MQMLTNVNLRQCRLVKLQLPLQLNNSFLLGLDTGLIIKKSELREKEKNISKLKAQLNNPEFKKNYLNYLYLFLVAQKSFHNFVYIQSC